LVPAFDEGPVIGAAFSLMIRYDASHLGGNSGERLASEIRLASIFGDVALEFLPKSLLPLADRDPSGDPERSAQAGITELASARDVGRIAELRDPVRRTSGIGGDDGND